MLDFDIHVFSEVFLHFLLIQFLNFYSDGHGHRTCGMPGGVWHSCTSGHKWHFEFQPLPGGVSMGCSRKSQRCSIWSTLWALCHVDFVQCQGAWWVSLPSGRDVAWQPHEWAQSFPAEHYCETRGLMLFTWTVSVFHVGPDNWSPYPLSLSGHQHSQGLSRPGKVSSWSEMRLKEVNLMLWI